MGYASRCSYTACYVVRVERSSGLPEHAPSRENRRLSTLPSTPVSRTGLSEAGPAEVVPLLRSEAAVLGLDLSTRNSLILFQVIKFLLILGFATTTNTTPDPQVLNRLRVVLLAGAAVLILLFGLVLMFSVIRIVRRRYLTQKDAPHAAESTPWQAAGQRVQPVEGGELVEGSTPDDDPEGYLRDRQAPLDSEDPNEDTGPLPGEEDDDEDDDDRW